MTDKKRNNRILSIFIALSLLMGVVCNMAIPVFASGASVPSEDTYRVSFTNDQLTFRTERTTYTIADADASNLVKIPLYFWYSSSAADNTYMSGWVIMAQSRFMNFTFNTGSVVPSYFEAYDGGSYYCSSPVSDYRFTVYFDNHIAANNTPYLLGYYVFDVSRYTAIQIDVTSGTTNVNIASSGVYGSSAPYGLVQSVVDGINSSSDIDQIIYILQNIDVIELGDILSAISDNGTLLAQIYQRLGQMQLADNQFYSDIDNIIDTVSWSTMSYTLKGLSLDKNNYQSSQLGGTKLYFGLTAGSYLVSNNIYFVRLPISVLRPQNIKNVYLESNGVSIGILEYHISRAYTDIFFTVNGAIQEKSIDFVFEFTNREFIYYLNVANAFFKYISGDDIEYWNIYNTLQNDHLYNLIESYINANVSSPVDQAATQAAGLATDQHAAEASLAALSPADMSDFDSAVSEITILDDVSQSLVFWTNAVNAFSLRSGSLWGVFIFGLLIGLIAFILRLRR